MSNEIISLSHGSGGKATNKLINNLFYKYFDNDILNQKNDSAVLPAINNKIAISTDSFVIKPIFFNGGDIGKLSICGTVNDISMSGATPIYISVGFIIEEGFEISELEKIVTGDTKVVERGSCDKIYINTTGIGIISDEKHYYSGNTVKDGDIILLSGTIGEHGMCIINQRDDFGFDVKIKSDCCLLNKLIKDILSVSDKVKVLRDPTRGGVATTLNEIIEHSNISMEIRENCIPVKKEVAAMCDILGFDPLYVANEGKLLVIVDKEDAEAVLNIMKKNKVGKDSVILGQAIQDGKNKLYLKTELGGKRIISMPDGELLVRIC